MQKFKDKYGRIWELPKSEVCDICSQPDNLGECNHKKISTSQYRRLTIQLRKNEKKNT